MTQHIFIDVEALGPPGIGNPFALGAVVFDATGIHSRHQWNIDVVDFATTQGDTLAWLSRQPPEVLAQLRDGKPFTEVWQEFLALVRGVEPIFWADDFSDFAWLDREARVLCLTPLRDLGSQYDSSAILRLASPLPPVSTVGTPHVAVHDAERGAEELLAALATLGRTLPRGDHG